MSDPYYDVGIFTGADYAVFALCLIISALIGLFFACTGNRQRTSKEFFLGDGKMSPFPVSVSLVASFVSAITVLGTPAEVYIYGSMFWIIGFAFIGAGLMSTLFIPIFMRIGITSNNEVSGTRYTGCPRKKRNSQYGPFVRTLLWSTVIFFTLLDRASYSHYINTKIIKFGHWRTFYFMSNFLWTVIFGICSIFLSFEARWQINGKSRKWQKLLIK